MTKVGRERNITPSAERFYPIFPKIIENMKAAALIAFFPLLLAIRQPGKNKYLKLHPYSKGGGLRLIVKRED
jgi:hypothetical protein